MGRIEYGSTDIQTADVVNPTTACEVDYDRVECKDKLFDCFRWAKANRRDILIVVAIVLFFIGINTINFVFYVLGTVYGDDWNFMLNPVGAGFYIFYLVVFVLFTTGLLTYVINELYKFRNRYLVAIFLFSTGVLLAIPFGTASHLIYVEYGRACDDYIYEFIILDNKFYNEGTKLFDITSSTIGTTHLKVTAGPLPGFSDQPFEQTYGADGVSSDGRVVMIYDSKLLIDGTVKSTNTRWYNNPMKMIHKDGKIFSRALQSPFNDNEYKMCMNSYNNDTLLMATIIPRLQKHMHKCHKCISSCTSECVHWSTRIVPHTTRHCDSKGHCTSSTYYTTETYCSQYRSYSECAHRCRYPACVGIGL